MLKWVNVVWRDGRALCVWQDWTIDNYDAIDSYEEMQLEMTKRFSNDRTVRGAQFHQLRNDLIQVEL